MTGLLKERAFARAPARISPLIERSAASHLRDEQIPRANSDATRL